jgi:CBS domain-containing protein
MAKSQKSNSEESKPQESAAEKAPAKEDTKTVAKEAAETEQETAVAAGPIDEKAGDADENATGEEAEATTEEEEAAETERDAEQAEPTEPIDEKAGDADEDTARQKPQAEAEAKSDDVDTDASDSDVEEKAPADETDESKKQPVSETIQRMTQSPPALPGESEAPTAAEENTALSDAGISLAMCAKDVMQKQIVWGGTDDSVQQALTKMQQADVGYMMIGADGVLEGIVSKSDLTGAISPYLRPVFAKWRRPLDDATLQINIKWIMSRPVRTIKPETPLTVIMENMCRAGARALPVVDQQGEVQGLVTVFDIFKALLKSNPNISTEGKTPEAPPLA